MMLHLGATSGGSQRTPSSSCVSFHSSSCPNLILWSHPRSDFSPAYTIPTSTSLDEVSPSLMSSLHIHSVTDVLLCSSLPRHPERYMFTISKQAVKQPKADDGLVQCHRQMVPRPPNPHCPALHPSSPLSPKPRRPARQRCRPTVEDRPSGSPRNSQGVDSEVRLMNRRNEIRTMKPENVVG